MATTKRYADSDKPINPTITARAHQRLEELAALYRTDKYTIANVALEYGAWNFENAWKRYNEQRAGQYEDDADRVATAEASAGNVVKLPSPNAANAKP